MTKRKPRHNPNKKQNKYGGDGECPYWHGPPFLCCERGRPWMQNCKGNQHYCYKTKLKFLASLPPRQRIKYGKWAT